MISQSWTIKGVGFEYGVLCISFYLRILVDVSCQASSGDCNADPCSFFFFPFHMLVATMYELRAGLTAYRKKDLLVEVAKWSGDGLRLTCLKMSS